MMLQAIRRVIEKGAVLLFAPKPNFSLRMKVFSALLAVSLFVFCIDVFLLNHLSVRHMLFLPVLASAFLERRNCIYAFVAISALLFAAARHISIGCSDPVHFAANFGVALLAYAVAAEGALMFTKAIEKLSRLIMSAEDEISRLREEVQRLQGG